MIGNRDILNCLPLLASVLGNRYGVKVRIGGTSAFTNGKTIQIPALSLDSSKTAIALAKGYIDHEASHIRFTDFEALKNVYMRPVTKPLCNSIEDWRVEKCLSELYPGCRSNLAWLARHIFLEKGTEKAGNDPAFSVLNYILLTVRSWEVEELNEPLANIRSIISQTFPGLLDKLDKILDRVWLNCPDTSASIKYAFEITDLFRNYENDCPGLRQKVGDEDGRKVGREYENSFENDRSSTKGGEDNKDLKALLEAGEDELPSNLGELLAEKMLANLPENESEGVEVAICQDVHVEALPVEEKQAALKSSNALRYRLSGLLQAQELKRIASARKGRLNTAKLARLSTGNPEIFNREAWVKRSEYGSAYPAGCKLQYGQ